MQRNALQRTANRQNKEPGSLLLLWKTPEQGYLNRLSESLKLKVNKRVTDALEINLEIVRENKGGTPGRVALMN